MPSKTLFAILLSFATLAQAAAPEPIEKIVGLRVTVDASGWVQTSKPTNTHLPEALNQAADELARKLHFNPARMDGRAVPSETTLHLTLRLLPNDKGGYAVRLVAAENGPLYTSIMPPRYPLEQDRRGINARLVAIVPISADGVPEVSKLVFDGVSTSSGTARDAMAFKDVVKRSLRTSRFDMDLVDGKPIASVARVPFGFCAGDRSECTEYLSEDEPRIHLSAVVDGNRLPEVAFSPDAATPAGT